MTPHRIERRTRPWGEMATHEWAGREPGYLFLHGHGQSAADWEPIAARLTTPRRAFAVDFAAHGDSDVPRQPFTFDDLVDDVVDFIDTAKARRLTLVGHSLGGMVGIAVAARCAAVAALVLVEGWTSSRAWSAFDNRVHRFGGLDQDDIDAIEASYARLNDHLPERLADPFWRTVCDFDGSDMLASLTIPVHEIYGSAGRRDDTQAQLMIPDRPNIRLHWVDGAGHFLPRERPAEVATLCEIASAADPQSHPPSGLNASSQP